MSNDEEPIAETFTVGATKTLTRALSEADLALFALVMGDAELDGEARLDLEPRYQRMASPALLGALLTSCAALHSGQPASAHFDSARMRFIATALAEETVRVNATVTGHDEPTGALQIAAICEAEDGRTLAEAEFLLRND